jgi:DNA-3-methyladenine glycosylase
MKLKRSFYLKEDVLQVARELLGKVLVTNFPEGITTGIITETEAYCGVIDRASHAFDGKRTPRNELMYARGGTAYVYLCYGIHHLFNVVTHRSGTPHAVLVRALQPLEGLELMQQRRKTKGALTTGGPGTLTQALGIRVAHNGMDLLGDTIHLVDQGIRVPDRSIIVGPRIGVDYAGADALLPYRFRYTPTVR